MKKKPHSTWAEQMQKAHVARPVGENLSAILRDTSKDPQGRIREYTRKMNHALFGRKLLEEIPAHEARAKGALNHEEPAIREIAKKILECLEEIQRRIKNGYDCWPVVSRFHVLRQEGNRIFGKLQRYKERSKAGRKGAAQRQEDSERKKILCQRLVNQLGLHARPVRDAAREIEAYINRQIPPVILKEDMISIRQIENFIRPLFKKEEKS